MVYIYVLERNNVPFYIGKTINITHRLWEHKKKKSADYSFIIDIVNEDEWKFWEEHYISLFKSWGFDLENKNNGGGGPPRGAGKGVPIHSEEQKKKWSEERKGKPKYQPTGIKHKKGYTFNKTKIHSNKGIPLTEEHKQKCAEGKHKSVLIYDKNNNLIKECQSIEETALFLQCSKGNVSQNLKEKTKTCKGYILKYK
jgi:hypothetical protein